MGVFNSNRPIYYREASVFVGGKYNREVSIDKVMEIKKNCVEKYGHHLNRLDIVYNSKKKGIVAIAYTLSEAEADARLTLQDRLIFHQTHILYGASKRSEPFGPYHVYVQNADYGF